MDGRVGHATLEEILAEVENDATLAADGSEARERDGTAETVAGETDAQAVSGLGALLSHPELLSKLPMLLRAVQSLTEPPRGDDKPPRSPEALLCALRPYLNESRRRALDTMIRVTRLSDSLSSSGK